MASLTLATLRTRLRVYLNDTNNKVWTTDTELDTFLNHAIIKFSTDLPTASSKLFTIADDKTDDEHTYTIPSDLVAIDFIRGYFETANKLENISEVTMRPGSWDELSEPRGYVIDWPSRDSFYLPRMPKGITFTMYYGAFVDEWLDGDDDTFDFGRNRWGEQALLAYSAYLAFNPSSSRRAQLEQWNRRGDANVGNPLEEEAGRWLALYESLLDQHAQHPDSWEFVRQPLA